MTNKERKLETKADHTKRMEKINKIFDVIKMLRDKGELDQAYSLRKFADSYL